jgi:putative hydrolase of the HAD superfamily
LVIFDLGGVIVELSHREMAAAMAERSADPRFRDAAALLFAVFESDEALTRPFDEGKISPREFYELARRRFRLRLSFDEFVARWNRSFKENAGVTALIERLSPGLHLFLLSNTNPLHHAYLESRVAALRKMEQQILSYEVGHRKPSPVIFQAALERAGVSAEEAVYIDDIEEYVLAAGRLGMDGIVFRSAERLEEEFQRRGLIKDAARP